MSKENLERRDRLIAYVEDNIRRLEVGEISRLPTGQYLADRFGYRSPGCLDRILLKRGIKLKEYAPPYKLPRPSSDLAWFLGIVSAGGYVTLSGGHGRIRLEDEHSDLLRKFRFIGERLFSVNCHTLKETEKQPYPVHIFYSTKVARFLGDLRDHAWARTILSTHPWVINNSRYIWGFVNGYFEKRGRVCKTPRNHRIEISTPSLIGANLLVELLSRQGLEFPTISYSNGKVKRVRIDSLEDTILFARNVYSEIPEKETILAYYRSNEGAISD